MGRHEHRQPLAAGLLARALFHSLDKRRHGGQPLLFHEKRDRLHTAFEGPLDHLLRLGDEQRPLRLQLAAQLSLGQPRERIEPRIVQRVYIDKGHRYLQKKKSQLNYSWRERAGGAKVSESPTGACNCLAFCPSVLWYAPRQKQETRAGACRLAASSRFVRPVRANETKKGRPSGRPSGWSRGPADDARPECPAPP